MREACHGWGQELRGAASGRKDSFRLRLSGVAWLHLCGVDMRLPAVMRRTARTKQLTSQLW